MSSKNRNHTVGANALDCKKKKNSSNFPVNNDAYEGAIELPIFEDNVFRRT